MDAAAAAAAAAAATTCLLPSQLNTAAHGPGLEVFCDKLTVHYKGEGRHGTDVGSIQANRPVPLRRSLYYFEVTVLERGDMGRIAIGFTDKSFKLNKQPGWDPDSYGYHGDDGKKFGGTSKGEEYGPRFSKGDTVGACFNLARQEIFFTKNGNRLRTAFRNVRGELFPTVGLHSKGEVVRINFGQHPFKFDIESMVSEERAAQAAAIDRVSVSSNTVHQIVRQYLLHYGYGDTLKAFDSEAGFAAEAGQEQGEAKQGEEAGTKAAERHNGLDHAEGEDAGPCSMAVDQDSDATPSSSAPASSSTPLSSSGQLRSSSPPPGPSIMQTDDTATTTPATDATAAQQHYAGDVAGGGRGVEEVWGQRDEWMRDGALRVRQFVRRSIMAGHVSAAVACISHTFPQVLQGGPGLEGVRYHLATQQYIELVRSGEVQAAVAFAQGTLASLVPSGDASGGSSSGGGAPTPPTTATTTTSSGVAGSAGVAGSGAGARGVRGASGSSLGPSGVASAAEARSGPGAGASSGGGAAGAGAGVRTGAAGGVNEAALRDVVALVAYERPEASPLAWLLGQEQRERVADAVNAALLWQAYGGRQEGVSKSRVEQLLSQLVAVQDTAFELNGSQGETFELDDHLLPREEPDDDQDMACN